MDDIVQGATILTPIRSRAARRMTVATPFERSASSARARWAAASPMSSRSPAMTSCTTIAKERVDQGGHRHHRQEPHPPGRPRQDHRGGARRRRSPASRYAETYASSRRRDLVIEAATEDETVKRKIFVALCPFLKPDAIVATNTSSISITRLAAATDRPERFIGLHFMNPAPVMELVEMIRGIATEDVTFGRAKEFVESSARRSRSRRTSRPSWSTASCCR